MRIRHLSMVVALMLPMGMVALSTDEARPKGEFTTAALTTDERVIPNPDVAWLVRQDERLDIEQAAADAEAVRLAAERAAEAERQEAEAARLAAEAAEAKAALRRSQATSTTVARRYTATTVASSPVTEKSATGSLPPKRVSDCESGGNPRAVNPNGHYGKWQFSQSTWESVGGTGRPDQASEAEQDYRASLLWDDGAGAGHWACY